MKYSLIKINNLKKRVVLASLFCCVMLLGVSIANSTYSLETKFCPDNWEYENGICRYTFSGFTTLKSYGTTCEVWSFMTPGGFNTMLGLYELDDDGTKNYQHTFNASDYTDSMKNDDNSCYFISNVEGQTKEVILNPNYGTIWDDQLSTEVSSLTLTANLNSDNKYVLNLIYNTSKYLIYRSGYTLVGWSTVSGTDGQCTPAYKTGAIILGPSSTYYACWEKDDEGTSDNTGTPVITCSTTSIGLYCNDANTNGAVTQLQIKLKYLGYYNDDVDGNAGINTVSAIKKFQQDEGLTVDGNAGPSTLERLRLRYNEKIQENDDEETQPDEEVVPTNPLTYYTLKYDTNGGTFANGESIRTIVVSDEAIIESPPYNPTKDGYKFDGWYTSSGQKYIFYQSLTADTTLTAQWTKYEETNCTYTCNNGDLYDPSSNICISVETFSNDKNLISNLQYNKICDNGLSFYSDYSCTGNCNQNNCSSEYSTVFWYEANDCYFGSSCSGSDTSSCLITMKKECYKTYQPNYDCKDESGSNDENINKNPQTGNVLIIMVWVIGISALIYSIYYYSKNKKIN